MMNRPCLVALLIVSAGGGATTLGAQQIDTVRVGSAALRGARLSVGTYGIESFSRADGVDTPMSRTTQTISVERQGGEEVYVIRTRHVSNDTTHSSMVVRARDFSLLHHRVKATADSAAVTMAAGYLTGWVVLPNEPIRLLDRQLEHPVFPVEGQMPWLFPLLPLEEGYAAAIPHFSQWQGSEEWKTIRVLGSESVEHEGKRLDCWKIDGGELFPGYRITYWVEKSTRRIMQGVARGSEAGPEYWARAIKPL